jgi:hypothetical protein
MFGMEAVHTALDELCKEEYDFLKKIYGNATPATAATTTKAPATAAMAAPVTKLTEEFHEEIPRPEVVQKIRPDTKVRIVKKPSHDEPSNTVQATPQPQVAEPTPVTQVQAPMPPAVQTVQTAIQQKHTESGFTDPKDIKRWQREQEDKKKRELDEQGINPASLLTKENLHRWIVEEKKTFAAVAREYVGLPDSMISSAAKSHGIQSETSKRRSMIAASKSKR